MLIPRKPKRSRQSKKDWFNKEKIKKPVKKELAEKTKKLIEKKSKSHVKEVVFSYMCSGCRSSFSAGNLRKQIIEAARRKDTYISCPKCGSYLVADRTTKVSTKQNSKVNRNANLTITYPNQGITPNYVPSSWTDRAVLEKIAHELGKFAASVGMFNPQLKFQRGIRGKISTNAVENVKAAEYTIEAVDDYDLRFRVVAAAGITPAGKVVLPKYFMTLDGREIPFTKEAVAEFLSGKVFGSTDPKPVVPELHYKDRDPVRFREIVASRKKKAFETGLTPEEDLVFGLLEEKIIEKEQTLTEKESIRYLELKRKKEKFMKGEKASKKKAAGTPTPGQTVEYQGKNYTIDSITGDASILTDEAGVQTAPVPNADLNVQFEEGAMPAEISAPTLASREKFGPGSPDTVLAKDLPNGWTITLDSWYKRDSNTFIYGVCAYPTKEPEEGEDVKYLWESKEVDADNEGAVNAVETQAKEKFEQYKEEVSKYETPSGHQYSLADRINKLVKRSLRDEKTLVPFTDPAPDYSVAKQTDVDADFSIPYEDSDQGILPEEERAVQKMFRGGSVIKPVKTAAEMEEEEEVESKKESSIKKTAEEIRWEKLLSDFSYAAEKEGGVENWVRVWGGSLDNIDSIDKAINDWASENGLEVTDDDVLELRTFLITQAKTSSIKKVAEPTGYHETDDTGKVIELSRLRTLVQDYARAGQIPLDFDLTKVMSEVSRMTRKDLLEILDKKQKDTHYPVVHAKKEGLEKKAQNQFTKGDRVELISGEEEYFISVGSSGEILEKLTETGDISPAWYWVKFDTEEEPHSIYVKDLRKVSSKKPMRKKISSKSTNAIVREIRKKALVGDITEEDVKKDIKEEKEGEKHYNQMAKDVDSPKTEKVLKDMADEEAEHAEDLEEIVLPAVKNTEHYLEKYDSRKKKTADSLEIDTMYTTKQLDALGYTYWEAYRFGDDNVVTNQGTGECYRVKQESYNKWVVVQKFSSKKKAQEEGEEEKPKTTLKELKTKPHGRPAPEEVAEAPAAAPELQTVFNKVKKHQQRLSEIKAVINAARQKTEEEIRKIQEEQGSVEEAAELQEGIEKLSSLIEQSESQIADLGEFFVFLDTSMKTKKFKPTDKWRVEKLLAKFGKDAEEYLAKAEKGASSLDDEVQQRLLTVFPKLPKDKESSMKKKADVLSAITELGSGLWSYVKEISGILAEGEQLELALE